MLEVELKVKIPSLDPVREQLVRKNAGSAGKVHEHDIYYNAPHRDFGQTDEAVRVRYTDDHAVVTYKGPKIKKFGLKAREELNFAVESGENFETMLDRLGFQKDPGSEQVAGDVQTRECLGLSRYGRGTRHFRRDRGDSGGRG